MKEDGGFITRPTLNPPVKPEDDERRFVALSGVKNDTNRNLPLPI
jgi:hypothetical protein